MKVQIQKRFLVSHTGNGWHTPCALPSRQSSCLGGVQLSSQARMMLQTMRIRNSLGTGSLGGLMSMFGTARLNGRQGGSLRSQRPRFGESRGAGRSSVVDGGNAPQAAHGQARELKAGETVRGANGSLVRWGQDGNVDITYKDSNGQNKNIKVKDGMMSIDGGKPRKLGNTGQLLKLPNGDVVGLGNNPQAQGQKLCRVVMADNVDQVKCEPASATNIYDIAEIERQQTRMQGGGMHLNYSQGASCTPWGCHSYASASLSVFRGVPVTARWVETVMNLIGKK
jgi:hypothetical protein